MKGWMFTKLFAIIASHIHRANHYAVYLIQCYMSIMFQQKCNF